MRHLSAALRPLALLSIVACLGACAANLYEDPATDPPSVVDQGTEPNFKTSFLFDVEAALGVGGYRHDESFFVLADGSVGLFVRVEQRTHYLHVDSAGTLLQRIDLEAALGDSEVRVRYDAQLRSGDHLLLQSQRTAYYFNLRTGTPTWQLQVEGRIIERPSGLFVYNTPCPGTQSIKAVDPATGDLRELISWPFVPGHPRVDIEEIDWLDDGTGASGQEAFAKTLYVTLSGTRDTVVTGDTSQISYITSTLYDAETVTPIWERRRATAEGHYGADFHAIDARSPVHVLQLGDEVWSEDVRTGEVFWRKPASEMPHVSRSGAGAFRALTADWLFGSNFSGGALGYTLHVPTGAVATVKAPAGTYSYSEFYPIDADHVALTEHSTGSTRVINHHSNAILRTVGPLFSERWPSTPQVAYVPAADRLVFYNGRYLYAVNNTGLSR